MNFQEGNLNFSFSKNIKDIIKYDEEGKEKFYDKNLKYLSFKAVDFIFVENNLISFMEVKDYTKAKELPELHDLFIEIMKKYLDSLSGLLIAKHFENQNDPFVEFSIKALEDDPSFQFILYIETGKFDKRECKNYFKSIVEKNDRFNKTKIKIIPINYSFLKEKPFEDLPFQVISDD